MNFQADQTLPTLAPQYRPSPNCELVAGASAVGHVRKRNEDTFVIADFTRGLWIRDTNLPRAAARGPGRVQGHGLVALVADGMGGHSNGALASAVAADAFIGELSLVAPQLFHGNDANARELIAEAVDRCHKRLKATANRKEISPHLGTTLTSAILRGDDLYIAHVGDSRAYHWRRGKLSRLTEDHTYGAALRKEGIALGNHPMAGRLTNALTGTNGDVWAEILHRRLEPGDRILVCSDGLHKDLGEAQISAILAQEMAPRQTVDDLINTTLRGPAHDNVTCVVVQA